MNLYAEIVITGLIRKNSTIMHLSLRAGILSEVELREAPNYSRFQLSFFISYRTFNLLASP